jgi:hypothetical protein
MQRLCLIVLTFMAMYGGYGQTCPTIGQIYNYAVGDTFEITSGQNSGNGSSSWLDLEVVLARQSFPDSIVYTIADWSGIQNGDTASEKINQLAIYNLNQAAAPNYAGVFCITCGTVNSNYSCDSCSCTTSESCIGGSTWSQTLECGLGQTYFNVYCDLSGDPGDANFSSYAQQLIYYHKANGNTSGNFVPLISAIPVLTINSFEARFNPNPSSGLSTLLLSRLPNSSINITLFDAVDRLVLRQTITSTSTFIDLVHQPKGFYFWQIESNENTIGRGKLLIQ